MREIILRIMVPDTLEETKHLEGPALPMPDQVWFLMLSLGGFTMQGQQYRLLMVTNQDVDIMNPHVRRHLFMDALSQFTEIVVAGGIVNSPLDLPPGPPNLN